MLLAMQERLLAAQEQYEVLKDRNQTELVRLNLQRAVDFRQALSRFAQVSLHALCKQGEALNSSASCKLCFGTSVQHKSSKCMVVVPPAALIGLAGGYALQCIYCTHPDGSTGIVHAEFISWMGLILCLRACYSQDFIVSAAMHVQRAARQSQASGSARQEPEALPGLEVHC
jgi:hypothetical protein